MTAQIRRNPGTKSRATSTTPIADTQFTAHRRQDGFTAPAAEERRADALLAEVKALGYGITMPCLICGHPLTSPRSLARLVGPKCAAKLAEVTE